MLELYRTVYLGWNVKHFHEHGVRDHNWGYTWTKAQLHTAGLVGRARTSCRVARRSQARLIAATTSGPRFGQRRTVNLYG
jgi:hypothetical protein